MTCYLNTLLQAFFFLPEFRNGIYEFQPSDDRCSAVVSALQRLFVKLQVIKNRFPKLFSLLYFFNFSPAESLILYCYILLYFCIFQFAPAVTDTDELTKAFGWSEIEGWEQQDIDELFALLNERITKELTGGPFSDFIPSLFEGEFLGICVFTFLHRLSADITMYDR